jgi:hypothetical protein
MTRQEQLNAAWCKYMGKCSTEILQALAFALRWCDAHPNWISVDDELPKENGRYLFYHTITGVQSSYYYKGLSLDKAVTHWMPLPEPPEHLAGVSKMIGSSEKPNNCKKFGMKGYENVVIHEGNAKGGVL